MSPLQPKGGTDGVDISARSEPRVDYSPLKVEYIHADTHSHVRRSNRDRGCWKPSGCPHTGPGGELVRQLREFRAALPPSGPSNGVIDPIEERRRQVYAKLRDLDDAALPALIRGLNDPDEQLRRNVAFFLGVAAGRWWDSLRPRMNTQRALPALITSLEDVTIVYGSWSHRQLVRLGRTLHQQFLP